MLYSTNYLNRLEISYSYVCIPAQLRNWCPSGKRAKYFRCELFGGPVGKRGPAGGGGSSSVGEFSDCLAVVPRQEPFGMGGDFAGMAEEFGEIIGNRPTKLSITHNSLS